MKVEKIDTAGWYKMVLNGAGIKADSVTTELILQLFKVVEKKKGEVDLRDIVDTRLATNGLFGLDYDGNPIA
jgi:hypothetical protein